MSQRSENLFPDGDAETASPVPQYDGPHENLFRAIANYTYDWETWMGADDRPRWINPAVERITGHSPSDCMSMDDYPMPLVHPDDRETIMLCLDRAKRDEPGNDVEFKILHKDGSERWGAVSWQTISSERGEAIGYRTSVRDITLRKHTEQALRRAQQAAEKASADKSRFLASASHDLRQPIQAATMFAAALARAAGEGERDHIVSSLTESLSATNELLDALLDVSRLDAGVAEPVIETIHLVDLFEHVEVEFEAEAKLKGLDLTVVSTSHSVTTDPVMLLRIVRNLVSNAMRYTDEGRVLVGARRRGGALRIEVWDTGIGIESADIGAIFEDFRQLGNPERDRRKGLGLGLAIVKRKADLLGLDVGVCSRPGRGSMFSIGVPVAEPREAGGIKQQTSYDDIDLAGRKVLYIDDDELQLLAMKTVLGQWGVDVACAASGEQAANLVLSEGVKPDLIVADFRLRDGEDGTRAIGQVTRAIGETVPAMILTGDTEPARISEAMASGYALLHKPVSPSILKQTIYDLLV